jgi:hypothetical protein
MTSDLRDEVGLVRFCGERRLKVDVAVPPAIGVLGHLRLPLRSRAVRHEHHAMAGGATVSAAASPHGDRAARRARARTPHRRRPRAARSGSCRALDSRPGRPRRACAVRFSCSRRRERPPPSHSVADHPSRCSLAEGAVPYASTAKEGRRPDLTPHLTQSPIMRETQTVSASPWFTFAGPSRARERPGHRARTAARASESRPPVRASRSEIQLNASEVAHHDPSNADDAFETQSRASRSDSS